MSAREQVREYVQKVLKENKDDTDPVGDNDSLVLSGRLSSLDVVDVLTFLEGEFSFEMDPNDFDQAKFDTVDSIVEMLEKQTA
jgi:acyl carrier protein